VKADASELSHTLITTIHHRTSQLLLELSVLAHWITKLARSVLYIGGKNEYAPLKDSKKKYARMGRASLTVMIPNDTGCMHVCNVDGAG